MAHIADQEGRDDDADYANRCATSIRDTIHANYQL